MSQNIKTQNRENRVLYRNQEEVEGVVMEGFQEEVMPEIRPVG